MVQQCVCTLLTQRVINIRLTGHDVKQVTRHLRTNTQIIHSDQSHYKIRTIFYGILNVNAHLKLKLNLDFLSGTKVNFCPAKTLFDDRK